MNLAERIDDFLEERANAEADWDEQVSAFRDFVEMELQEQREECAVDAVEAFQEADTMAAIPNAIMRACLNAVEKKI